MTGAYGAGRALRQLLAVVLMIATVGVALFYTRPAGATPYPPPPPCGAGSTCVAPSTPTMPPASTTPSSRAPSPPKTTSPKTPPTTNPGPTNPGPTNPGPTNPGPTNTTGPRHQSAAAPVAGFSAPTLAVVLLALLIALVGGAGAVVLTHRRQ